MPQLDFISFYSQVFWLFLFFILCYIVIVKNVMPFICQVFKVRYYIGSGYSKGIGSFQEESISVLEKSDKIVYSNCQSLSTSVSQRYASVNSFILDNKVDSLYYKNFFKVFVSLSSFRYLLY